MVTGGKGALPAETRRARQLARRGSLSVRHQIHGERDPAERGDDRAEDRGDAAGASRKLTRAIYSHAHRGKVSYFRFRGDAKRRGWGGVQCRAVQCSFGVFLFEILRVVELSFYGSVQRLCSNLP